MSDPCNCDLARSEPLDHKPGPHHLAGCPRWCSARAADDEDRAELAEILGAEMTWRLLGEHSSNPREDR